MQPTRFAPRPWTPLSDAEYAVLRTWLPHPDHGRARRGRPPQHQRRTLDAIFWIAAGREPWRALPPHLGKPDSASRQLRRWARMGVLDGLLLAVSGAKAAGGCAVLRGMGYWIARAWRRMARVLPMASLAFGRRLRVLDAWPSAGFWLPRADLSEGARRLVRACLLEAPGFSAREHDLLARSAARVWRAGARLLKRARLFRRGWQMK